VYFGILVIDGIAAPYLMRKNIILPFRLVFDMVSDILAAFLERKMSWAKPPGISSPAVLQPETSPFAHVGVIIKKSSCF
jgi:hypothetical protein